MFYDINRSLDALDELRFMVMLEAATDSKLILDSIYPKVEKVLSTPNGDRQFRTIIGTFIDKNGERLNAPGPCYNIPFTDIEKDKYFNLFDLDKNEVKLLNKECLKKINDKGTFRIISEHPLLSVLFCVNRFYSIKKDEKGLNLSLAVISLYMYPLVYTKYFKYGTNPAVMQYTVDNLSDKFILKKVGNIFSLWMHTIQQCYSFHKNNIIGGSDIGFVNYIMRIRNAYNSGMKKIASEFYKNYKAGNAVYTASDSMEDNPDGAIENDSNRVEAITDKILQNILTSGIDLRLAEAAARSVQVSQVDLRNYLNIILVEGQTNNLRAMIESIIFLFLYESKRTINDINSRVFLEYCLALYKKTNSLNKNITRIKAILDAWLKVVMGNKPFNRGHNTLMCYKRGIYIYFVLSIQKYS